MFFFSHKSIVLFNSLGESMHAVNLNEIDRPRIFVYREKAFIYFVVNFCLQHTLCTLVIIFFAELLCSLHDLSTSFIRKCPTCALTFHLWTGYWFKIEHFSTYSILSVKMNFVESDFPKNVNNQDSCLKITVILNIFNKKNQ